MSALPDLQPPRLVYSFNLKEHEKSYNQTQRSPQLPPKGD